MIYLDNSATTKPYPEALKSFQQVSEHYFGNPSSIHSLGGDVEKLLAKARQQTAELLGVTAEEIVFTSGGTEGNNMAVKGVAFEHMSRGKHIITTAIEHPSVKVACQDLERLGFDVTYLPVNQNGIVSVGDVEEAIRPDTILITIMHVNNELGSIQPVKEIGELAKHHPKLLFHVDGVQGLGKVPLELNNSGVDLCTFSGHKIHGLKGTGVLVVRKSISLTPLLHGGNQERARRSGTENVAGAVSLAKALRLTMDQAKSRLNALGEQQAYLRNELAKIDGVVVNTPRDAAPHILNFSVPGIKPEILIHTLDEKQIYVSTKSACSSKSTDESQILNACGLKRARTTSAIRVSLTYDTTEKELTTFLAELKTAIRQLKEVLE